MAIITKIDGIPLYSTQEEALNYAEKKGLVGFHTHMFQDQIGYMGGKDHNNAITKKGRKIELFKKIISHRRSNKIHAKSFNNLVKSARVLDDSKIEDIYNNLFYQIPKKGKNSHESIVVQSKDYLFPNINQKLDSKIDDLIEDIENLQKDFQDLKTPPTEHTDYPNGSMLTAGTFGGGQYQGMQDVYYMQNGRKRLFGSTELYKIVRKAEKFSGDDFSELIFLEVDELNAIPDGKHIEDASDLSIPNYDLNADYGEIYQRLPFHTLDLYCEGRERTDTFDLVDGDFWLDTDNDDFCIVKYIKNEFDGDEHLGPEYKFSIETETIMPGETKTITFAKDDRGLIGIPITEDDYNLEYDYELDIQQTGVRHWGKDRRFKGIVYAEGRLFITEGGDAFNTRQHGTIAEELTFDEMTAMGTRKIYTKCLQLDGSYENACYGSLGQDSMLEDLFNDPTFIYYKPRIQSPNFAGMQNYSYADLGGSTSISELNVFQLANFSNRSYSMYGQPILKIPGQNRLAVYLTSYVDVFDAATNARENQYHFFYDLVNKGYFVIDDRVSEIGNYFNKYTQEYVNYVNALEHREDNNLYPYIGRSNLGLNGGYFNWEFLNPEIVAYIGIKGTTTNGMPANSGNYFNPDDEGNNFELSIESQEILNYQGRKDFSETTVLCPYTRQQLNTYQILRGELPDGCTYTNCINC